MISRPTLHGPALSPDVVQGEEGLGVSVIHDARHVDVGEADLPVVELNVAGRLWKMEDGKWHCVAANDVKSAIEQL